MNLAPGPPRCLLACLWGLSSGRCGRPEPGGHRPRAPGKAARGDTQAARIAAIKEAARAAGVDLVLNARVDVFLAMRDAPTAEQVAEAVRRGRGGLRLPIMAADEDVIATLVAETSPLNVLLTPRTPGLARLAELGVARVSLGGGLHAHVMAPSAAHSTPCAQATHPADHLASG